MTNGREIKFKRGVILGARNRLLKTLYSGVTHPWGGGGVKGAGPARDGQPGGGGAHGKINGSGRRWGDSVDAPRSGDEA